MTWRGLLIVWSIFIVLTLIWAGVLILAGGLWIQP